MEDEIRQNIVFLTENLTNLTMVLTYLIQMDIISNAEREDIDAESTPTKKNTKLLSTLGKKDWKGIRDTFLEILQKTGNVYCAQIIQETKDRYSHPHEVSPILTQNPLFHLKLNKNWWPEMKQLTVSLLKRKFGGKILIEELKDRISKDKNQMLVICESPAASKYSGMGGVGKTLTAKWYAHTYEQEYDHILWIDCGEGSLLTSFESLARDLEIPNRNELVNVQDYARKCFHALTAFKCLWIYDNAENYKGEEGIINVLPKDEKNFYCIITSRSREWGAEKVGFGKISDRELDIFSEEESLEFLKATLLDSVIRTESQLKELGLLLGYLPLALQLTVAALNNGKIELQSYIEKTSSKDLGFIDEKFDDYEKTINKNIRITLDLILEQENGKLAYEMLMIFGYIRPDDIRLLFLSKVLNIDPSEAEEAINLLEKYALITKTGKVMEIPNKKGIMNKLFRKNEIKIEMDLLSIHRLLQQVIRYNGRKSEETLKKILSCVGFIDYKLIPFTKYASKELQKAFPKVRAELLDQRQLKKLISEERFEESVQLAKFIHAELKTRSTKFNYSVCLYKNGQKEECIDILKELYLDEKGEANDQVITTTFETIPELMKTFHEMKTEIDVEKYLKLIDLKKEPTKKEIGYTLFYYNLMLEKVEEALKIGLQVANEAHIMKLLHEMLRQKRFEDSVQLAKIIAENVNTKTSKFNLAVCLVKNEHLEESLDILKELGKEKMKETRKYSTDSIEMGMLALKDELSRDLVYIHLIVIQCRIELKKKSKREKDAKQSFEINYSEDSLGTLIRLVHSDLIKSNYSLVKYSFQSTIEFELGGESSKIELRGCSLDLSSFDRLSPEELELENVSLNRNGREVEEANLNEFCDFHKINKLGLFYGKMCIELSDEISMEYLHLSGVKVLNWKEARWNIQRLILRDIPFVEKTKMKVKEMHFESSSLDISCLPPTIEKLHLDQAEVVCNEPIDLPNLKYLTLREMSDSSLLSSFRSPNLTHIHFYWMKEVNVDRIPKSVTHIKISKGMFKTIVVGGVRIVDKLILELFSVKEVEELLGHFQTDELVLYSGVYSPPFTPKELIELTKKEIKRIAVGRIKWEEEDLSVLSSHVDRKADYYLWEGGRGRGMEEKEFEELRKLH